MYPSALPLWPGRELMQANRRCWENSSATLGSITRSFFLSSTLFWALADLAGCSLFVSFPFLPKIRKHSTDVQSVLVEVPAGEGGGVNGHDAVLDQGFGSDQLVIGGIVNHIQDSGFTADGFGSPVEVSFLEPEGSEFEVSSSGSYPPDSWFIILDEFSIGNGSSFFKSSLFFMNRHAAAGQSSFMS